LHRAQQPHRHPKEKATQQRDRQQHIPSALSTNRGTKNPTIRALHRQANALPDSQLSVSLKPHEVM